MKQLLDNIAMAEHLKATIDQFMSDTDTAAKIPLYVPLIGRLTAMQSDTSDRLDLIAAAVLPFLTETVAAHKELDLENLSEPLAFTGDLLSKRVKDIASTLDGKDGFKTVVEKIYNEHYTAEAQADEGRENPLEAMFKQAMQEVAEEAKEGAA